MRGDGPLRFDSGSRTPSSVARGLVADDLVDAAFLTPVSP